MKIIFLFLCFLICFSKLIDQVRKDVVRKALLNLPKRESLDILKMCLKMSSFKSTYSLNDAESAYLAYKWIEQNIEYDKNDEEQGNSSTAIATVYKTGKGGATGITGLFKTMCDRLKIKSDTILGLTKTSSGTIKMKIITKEYSWNYILINNKYYLIDVVKSIGFEKSKKRESDFYFGMDPETSIRLHFPNDNKWQFLPKNITKNKFKSMAYLDEGFYSLGLKTISPDIQSLGDNKRITIKLTSDKSFDEIFDQLEFVEVVSSLDKDYSPEIDTFDIYKISNGEYTFNFALYSGLFSSLSAKNKKTGEIFYLMCFDSI